MKPKDLHLTIIFDNKHNAVAIGSNNTPWMDMGLCCEGLGVICQKCIDDGIPKEKVYGEVQRYLAKVLSGKTKILTPHGE